MIVDSSTMPVEAEFPDGRHGVQRPGTTMAAPGYLTMTQRVDQATAESLMLADYMINTAITDEINADQTGKR